MKQLRTLKTLRIILSVVIPPPGKSGSAFSALTRTKKDLAKINAAAAVSLDGNVCIKARLAMGAVAPTHIRLEKCEQLLSGKEITPELLDELSVLVPEEITPIDDVRSSADYRRRVSGTLMKTVITNAVAGLREGE